MPLPETRSRHALAIPDGRLPPAQRVLVVPQEAAVQLEWSAGRPTTVHLEVHPS